MNDPGLDKPIEENAKEVENTQDDNVENEDPDGVGDDDEAYLEPSRWWFASTAVPLIAGTFGPMASAFNICAICGKWRVTAAAGQSADTGYAVPDPAWLIGVNVVSLVFALIANLALLFNMARRLSFTIAQPITIIGWFISSFLLIGLVVAAGIAPSFQLPLEENPSLSQAFYYAIMAAVLYFIISCLMCITVYGALKGHYPRAFKLTMSQRTLMIQTISYLVYLLAGGAVFSHIEDWLFLDGVYWANVTLLTIGTGDFYPASHLGQGLIFPYAIGGIVFLGLVVGSIRSLILERGKKKMGVRMVEKKREKIISDLDRKDGTVKVGVLTDTRNLAHGSKPEIDRRRQEFEVMRMIQNHARVKRKWFSLLTSLMAWFFLWFIGAVVFWIAERPLQPFTYFEAMYFSYISLLTIGYGDYHPLANSSKAFFVFWSLLAVPTLTILISNMGDTVVKLVGDSTMWLSEITVLPSDESKKKRLGDVWRKLRLVHLADVDEAPVEEQPGGVNMPQEDREAGRHGKQSKAIRHATDTLGKEYEEEELDEVEAARRRGDKVDEDKHFYHFLLVREIRNVMKDSQASPPKKYSYQEWTWYLRLLGEDESDSNRHRKPPLNISKENVRGEPDLGLEDEAPTTGSQKAKWSWIGARSPLLGSQDEPEWLLERLSKKLEQLLQQEHRSQRPGTKGKVQHLLSPQDSSAEPAMQRPSRSSSEGEKTLGLSQ